MISHSSPFVCIVCFSKLIHLFFLALFAYSWLLSSANVNDSSVCLCLFFVFMFMKYKCIRYETHKNNHNFISDYCILFKFYLMILQSLVIRHANLLKLDKKKKKKNSILVVLINFIFYYFFHLVFVDQF